MINARYIARNGGIIRSNNHPVTRDDILVNNEETMPRFIDDFPLIIVQDETIIDHDTNKSETPVGIGIVMLNKNK